MKKSETKCPHCGVAINIGSLMAKTRHARYTKEQRKELSKKLNEAKKKKLSTGI